MFEFFYKIIVIKERNNEKKQKNNITEKLKIIFYLF